MSDSTRQAIERCAGFCIDRIRGAGGGCISRALVVSGGGRECFVKLNRAGYRAMFEAEMEALNELASANAVRVPVPVAVGCAQTEAFIIMERLELRGPDSASMALLGERLAALHLLPQAYFGWHRDNTIGLSPQINSRHQSWTSFWRECRLQPQLAMAESRGYKGRWMDQVRRLCDDAGLFLESSRVRPSLLHGDLWSGNVATCSEAVPVMFDPACYYGDRECDLAMTCLFGGFDKAFYAAYESAFPLASGFEVRKNFYNLYHILNHLNLFGDGYLRQVESMVGWLSVRL